MVEKCLSSRNLSRCGVQTGFELEINGRLCVKEKEASAVFVSRTYDSGKDRMEWGRSILETSGSVVLQQFVWLFDEKQEGDALDLMEDVRQQFSHIQQYAQYHSNYHEMPIYGRPRGRGRFAKLAVEFFPGKETGRFIGYALSFPKESFTKYLPRIYRENADLENFLAVQQSIYLEMEEKIDSFSSELDYELCGKKQVEQLLSWMGFGELAAGMETETARTLLRTGISFISRKGTCEYYIKLTEILTGKKAVMVEEADKGRATVIVLGQPERGREKYLGWLRENTPLFARMEFVVLGRTERVDKLCFLDINAYISETEAEIAKEGVCIDRLVLL